MLKDETGNRHNRLTVIRRVANYKDGSAQWLCKCDCGALVIQKGASLRSGRIISCGCYNAEITAKHRRCFTPEYKSWQAMKDRCLNPSSKDFPKYGGRGITVCTEWISSFEAFFTDMGPRGFGESIDRKKNDEGYFRDNCRWATGMVQSANRRSTRFITIGEETNSVSDWARKIGITHEAFAKRLSKSVDPSYLLSPKMKQDGSLF